VSLSIQPASTDLLLPRAEPGATLHPYTVHTHYFGFSVPEAGIGAFLYARYIPAFGLAQGGPVIFRGMDNVSPLDVEYHDYRATMPWPEVEGGTIRLDCGYEIDVVKPGELIHLRYQSPDGAVGFDLDQRAVTPLVGRGHVVPGEEAHHGRSGVEHGGSEQFMHCTGELRLRGEVYAVDCHAVRDRSWNQVRTEDPDGAPPGNPAGWSPAWFGDDLAFNVTSTVSPDGETSAYYKWLVRNGELVELTAARRSVLEYHAVLHSAVRQELELTDGDGRRQRFEGRAIAVAPVYAWPNVSFRDSVFRWEDEQGRVTHCTYQEIFWAGHQRKMSRG
jgi:hypothetical protein